MAVDEGVKPNKDVEFDIMTDTLMSQDKLLKRAARERKEFKDKLKVVEKELEEAKKLVVHVSYLHIISSCIILHFELHPYSS
jgi:hypothetical protein